MYFNSSLIIYKSSLNTGSMSESLKILVIPSWYPPDGGYFFKEHSEALASEGCEISVLVNRVIGIRRLGRVEKGKWYRPYLSNENG